MSLIKHDRKVNDDGWVHEAPRTPGDGIETAGMCLIGFFSLCMMLIYAPIFAACILGLACILGPLFYLGSAKSANYCPECNRKTGYDPKQKRCLCGYQPIIAALCILVLGGAVSEASDFPVAPPRHQAESSTAAPKNANPYDVYESLFTKDMVAPDVTPEMLALMNYPSIDFAIAAYQRQILSIASFVEGARYYEAVRRYYEKKMEQDHGVTLSKSPRDFYKKLLAEFGYQDIHAELPAGLKPYDPLALTSENIAEYLRKMLGQMPRMGAPAK